MTKPRTLQTSGIVERFNGRLEQVMRTHRFSSTEGLETTLHRYAWLYNAQLPQKPQRIAISRRSQTLKSSNAIRSSATPSCANIARVAASINGGPQM